MLQVRLATTDDAKAVSEIYAYYVVHFPYSFEYEAPTAEEISGRITETLGFFPFYVCEENGAVLGFAYAHRYRERKAYQWVCETSIYVKNGLARKGVGAALYQKLLPVLKAQGFVKAFAILGCPNEGSERFHAKMGFVPLAVLPEIGYKLGGWHDIKYYVYHLNDKAEGMKTPVAYFMV